MLVFTRESGGVVDPMSTSVFCWFPRINPGMLLRNQQTLQASAAATGPRVKVGNPTHSRENPQLDFGSSLPCSNATLAGHRQRASSRPSREVRIRAPFCLQSILLYRGTLPTKKGERRAPSWGTWSRSHLHETEVQYPPLRTPPPQTSPGGFNHQAPVTLDRNL